MPEDACFLKSSNSPKFKDPTLSGTWSKCVGCSGMILGFHENRSASQKLLAVRREWYMDIIPGFVSLWSKKRSQAVLTVLQFYAISHYK